MGIPETLLSLWEKYCNFIGNILGTNSLISQIIGGAIIFLIIWFLFPERK